MTKICHSAFEKGCYGINVEMKTIGHDILDILRYFGAMCDVSVMSKGC